MELTQNKAKSVNRLAIKRAEKKMTQSQLAEKAGCSQRDVSRWENGRVTPSAASLKKLAEALECKVDDII